MLRLVLSIALATQAFSADLEIRYSALERMVAAQMFTEEGRRYVKGNQAAKCQYAYLEAPKLSASADRLQVAARFSGRSAMDLFNRCVGMGDSFNVNITAVPVPRKGAIAFQDTQVSTAKDSYYIRQVRSAMMRTFDKDFKIEIRDQARRLLEQPVTTGAVYQQELKDLDLNAIRVTPDALVLVVDFKLIVK
jgi:excinuclease UvrABC ATPase subunit